MKNIIRSAIFAFTCAVSASASAVTVYADSVSGSGAWDFVDFSHTGGALSIDALANGWTGGPTGVGIDDIFLSLFVNDGSSKFAFTGAYVGANDDSGSTFGDGSVSALDSFLNLGLLAAGNYTLAISHCCTNFDSVRNAALGSGVHGPYFDYQLTFSQDVNVSGVPEPGVIALFAIAVAGASVASRKRIAK